MGSNEPKKDKEGNPMYSTVCHNKCNGKHKLYYYHESKLFHCYTDCGDNLDIFELVVRAKKQQGFNYSFPQAVQYVAVLVGKTFGFGAAIQENNSDLIDDWEWINRHKKKDKINTKLPEYDSKVLDVFLPYPHEAWLNEGISYETQQKFNISYYMKDDRVVMPHYDIDSRLIGIRGRAMREEDIEAGKKYMPLTVENRLYNHQLMFNLYALNKTKHAISRNRKAIIFEGEKSCLKCEDFYGEDNFSVAVCSSNITNFHRDMLINLGVEEVFIAFDTLRKDAPEKEIELYQKKLLKFANKFTPYCRTYIIYDDFGLLPEKSSPADNGKEVLEQLMKCKYEINTTNEVE